MSASVEDQTCLDALKLVDLGRRLGRGNIVQRGIDYVKNWWKGRKIQFRSKSAVKKKGKWHRIPKDVAECAAKGKSVKECFEQRKSSAFQEDLSPGYWGMLQASVKLADAGESLFADAVRTMACNCEQMCLTLGAEGLYPGQRILAWYEGESLRTCTVIGKSYMGATLKLDFRPMHFTDDILNILSYDRKFAWKTIGDDDNDASPLEGMELQQTYNNEGVPLETTTRGHRKRRRRADLEVTASATSQQISQLLRAYNLLHVHRSVARDIANKPIETVLSLYPTIDADVLSALYVDLQKIGAPVYRGN